MNELIDIPNKDLAALLNVSPAFITNVKKGRKSFSFEHCLKINQSLGIPLWSLRPDVYPKDILINHVNYLGHEPI